VGIFRSNEALHFSSKENTFFNKMNLQSIVIILPDNDLHQFIHLQAFIVVVSGVSVYCFSKSCLSAFETFFTGNGTPFRTEMGEG
jgi:UDP-N-acetyl-D-mannosaminuronic acid transferase (WecB/TagA/CpsF family)